MADPTDEQLRRHGMADAIVVLCLRRMVGQARPEDLGSVLGLRQREVLDAIARARGRDPFVMRAVGLESRTPAEIRDELEDLEAQLREVKAELKAAIKAARDADRRARDEARAARAARPASPTRKTPEQRAARIAVTGGAPCPTCGHVCEDRRGLAMHSRSHETGVCDLCGGTFVLSGLGPHRRHCKGGEPDAA